MTTQALKAMAAANKPGNPAVDALNKAMAGIAAVLPAHISKERMAKLSLGVLRTNAKLYDAAKRNPASFVNSIMGASRLGLEPGIDAHLVPFENKKAGTVEITMIPDYRGLLKIARNSGEITSVSVQVVYQDDEFVLELGLDEKLVHKPKLDGARGEPLLVYGVARFRDGSHHVEWMCVADVNAIRDESQGYKTAKRFNNLDTPWVSDWPEMARKTLVRRMCKYLPRSVELMNAERIVEASDKGETAHFDGDFVVVVDEEPGGAQTNDAEIKTPPPAEQSKTPTPDAIEQLLRSAGDVDVLDAHADLIREVGDESKMAELAMLYRARRKLLTANQ